MLEGIRSFATGRSQNTESSASEVKVRAISGDIELQPTGTIRDVQDADILESMGYKPELKRSFSMLEMLGFVYSILCCWVALLGALAEVMLNGGPLTLWSSWIIVSFFSFFVALAMANICSAYPVAGGQYSWCLFLAKGTWWGRGFSYICAWIQLAGVVCMGSTAYYQFGLMVGGMGFLNSGGEFTPNNWKVCLFCFAAGLFYLAINIFGNKLLHHISTVALWWSILGFIVCFVTILACTSPNFATADFVFLTFTDTNSGWNNRGMCYILGFLQSSYGMACYDAPAHMSEELEHASRDAPRAIVLSVIIGFVTAFIFLIAILYCIQDLDAVVNTPTGFPLLEVFRQAAGEKGAMVLITIVLMCQVFAGNSLLTEGSRSIYAFARDGGFPFKLNKWFGRVSERFDVPIEALLLCIFFQFGFVAILFGSDAAFFTVLSVASIGMYVSYAMPLIVHIIRPNSKAPGYYDLGKWAMPCEILGVAYITFCTVFFFFPTSLPVDGNNMNYAIAAFGICFIFGFVSWFGGARKTYSLNQQLKDVDGLEGLEVPEEELKQDRKLAAMN